MIIRRALVCAPRMPEYDREGGSQRTFHLIELLRAAGWAVSFIGHDATGEENYATLLRRMGVATYAGAASVHAADDYITNPNELISAGAFDLAILTFWNVAEMYAPIIRSLSPSTRIIVDSIDLHFLRLARSVFHSHSHASVPPLLDRGYGDHVVREFNVYASADSVLAVSDKEAEWISDVVADPKHTYAIPLIEDMPVSVIPYEKRRGILFVGNFGHPPNIEAMDYLLRDIVPFIDTELLEKHPIKIVGNKLESVVKTLGAPPRHVEYIGWVPSVVPYFHHARVSVVPLLWGAGTKTKLIQSLTVGTPCVSTDIGIEGLDVHHPDDVLVANDARTFAQHITRLLTDAHTWKQISQNGRMTITRTHGREAVNLRFQNAITETFNKPAKFPLRPASSKSGLREDVE